MWWCDVDDDDDDDEDPDDDDDEDDGPKPMKKKKAKLIKIKQDDIYTILHCCYNSSTDTCTNIRLYVCIYYVSYLSAEYSIIILHSYW